MYLEGVKLEDPIQMLTDSLDIFEDPEVNPSGHSEQSLPIDRIHLSINLSLKLLWCTCILYSGHLHNMPKKKN
jgi:hypothetical protein